MFVVRRNDVGRRESEKVEESLFIHFCMKRDSPVILSITVPLPASKKRRDIVHLLRGLRMIRRGVASFVFALLSVVRIAEYISPLIQNLRIRIKQAPVELALPSVEFFHGRQKFIRIPIGS